MTLLEAHDFYVDDSSRIINGDNRVVMPAMPAGSVDVIFTSPPYNLGSMTGGLRRNDRGEPMGKVNLWRLPTKARLRQNQRWYGSALSANAYGIHDDDMPPADYAAWQRSFLRECWRLLSDRGAIFYNHKPRIQAGVVQLPTDFLDGLPLRQVIIWRRPGGMNFNETYFVPSHEWVLLIAKPGFRLKRGAAGSGLSDVWDINPDRHNPHPAPFPIDLPRRALSSIASPVEMVLDPFSGSGTTLRAAKDLGLRATGIELNATYCAATVTRLQQSVMPLELVG